MINLKRILHPTDFSPASRNAQRYAASFARAFGAKLYLLSVSQPLHLAFLDPLMIQDLDSSQEAAARENLDRLQAELSRQGIEVEAVMRRGSTSLEIVSFAEEAGIDLIVMGTHGWSGLEHILLGSTAQVVVRKAPCPVLTVRAAVHDFVES